MAVVIEAVTVVVRRDAVRRAFNGLGGTFEALVFNGTHRQDEHLHAAGFWNDWDAEAFITQVLTPRGLTWTRRDEAVDLAIVGQFEGPYHHTPWLETGQYSVVGGAVTAAWLAGTEPGDLKTHARWHYKGYSGISRSSSEESAEWQSVPSSRPDIDAKIDPESGKTLYTLRSPIKPPRPTPHDREARLHKLYGDFEKIWETARYVLMARMLRRRGTETVDLGKHETQLETVLEMVRQLARASLLYDQRAHFTEGYVLVALGRLQEAEPALRRAYALAPNSPTIVGELMSTLSELGKTADAIEVGRRSLPNHAKHPSVSVALAILLHSVGELDEALAALAELPDDQPEHEAANRLREQIEAKAGHPK